MTINDPVCYCPEAKKLCTQGQICNTMTSTCTDPLPVCPDYPEIAPDSGCVCHEDSICNSGYLCDEGHCRIPAVCQDPTQDQNKNLVLSTQSPVFTEGHSITVECKDCHHLLDDPDVHEYKTFCQPDTTWDPEDKGKT